MAVPLPFKHTAVAVSFEACMSSSSARPFFANVAWQLCEISTWHRHGVSPPHAPPPQSASVLQPPHANLPAPSVQYPTYGGPACFVTAVSTSSSSARPFFANVAWQLCEISTWHRHGVSPPHAP